MSFEDMVAEECAEKTARALRRQGRRPNPMTREAATKIVEDMMERFEWDGQYYEAAALRWLVFYMGQDLSNRK